MAIKRLMASSAIAKRNRELLTDDIYEEIAVKKLISSDISLHDQIT